MQNCDLIKGIYQNGCALGVSSGELNQLRHPGEVRKIKQLSPYE